MGERLTEARRRALQEIAGGGRDGVRPAGAQLTLAYGLRAWGWVTARPVRGFVQPRYFITEAGRAALAKEPRHGE